MKTKKKILICVIPLVIVVALLLIIKWRDNDSTKDQKVASVKETEAEVTKEPEVEATKEPEVEATKEPEVEATKEPEAEATKEPEADTTKETEDVSTVAGDVDKIKFVQQMGNGINIGNSLDAARLHDYKPDAPELEYETCWGNPKITPELLKAVHEAGFETVRIPVTFEDHMDEEYQISEVWMQRVEEVVKAALDEGLYVIMDTHHEDWLDLKVDQKEQVIAQFKAVWTQVALRFRDYDEHLLFEGMNEPRLHNTSYEWTDGTPELRDFVNELNRIFVDTVRESGGNNEDRFLLVATYCNQPWGGAVKGFPVPEGNIIVAVHMYSPYEFALNQGGTSKWSANNKSDTSGIDGAFIGVYNDFVKKGIPVIFTEYGCVDKNNLEERVAFGEYYNKKSKQYQIPIIWWDNGKEFNIINRSNYKVVYPEIVEAVR